MFNTNIDIFNSKKKEIENIRENIKKADILFVADFFLEDYVGGAELTTENLINSLAESGKNICKIKSDLIDPQIIQEGLMKHWVFCNYTGMNLNLIPTIIANLNYSIIEYDYKFCKYRSEHKHIEIEGKCNCENEAIGKMISTFYHGAEKIFWMSDKQKENYFKTII